MIRITRNDDINFNVDEIHGKGDRYNITFYTVNNAVNIVKHDTDVNDGIIVLNGSELMTLGDGVMNLRVDNIAQNADYTDGIFNSSFTKTTKYYIQAGIIVPDGSDTESVIEIVGNLEAAVNAEITRSTNKDNAHDAALANVYTKAEIDDMLDDVDLPENVVVDANYVHTDNNFTTTLKNKLNGIASGAEVNVQSDWDVTSTSSDAYIKNKPTKVSDFTNDAGYLTSETDPTVPAWAKAQTKPTYTASEVGALPSSTVIPTVDSTITGAAQTNPVKGGAIYTALSEKAGFKNYADLEEMNEDTPANGTIGFDGDGENFYIYDNANAEWKQIDGGGGGDLPANVVIDANYVHTDNNFTTAYKNTIDGLSDSITTREITAREKINTKEMIFTPFYADVPEDNKIGLNVAFDEDNERSIFEFYDYYTQAILRLPIIDGAEFVTTAGFPVKESDAGGSGTTQTTSLVPCTFNNLQVRTNRIRTINFEFAAGNTSYILLLDRSYLSGFPSLTTLNFEGITITWEGGNAFDIATFRSGSDSYALINLVKISDEVILGDVKLY